MSSLTTANYHFLNVLRELLELPEECVLLLQNVFSYYRMCSLTTANYHFLNVLRELLDT